VQGKNALIPHESHEVDFQTRFALGLPAQLLDFTGGKAETGIAGKADRLLRGKGKPPHALPLWAQETKESNNLEEVEGMGIGPERLYQFIEL